MRSMSRGSTRSGASSVGSVARTTATERTVKVKKPRKAKVKPKKEKHVKFSKAFKTKVHEIMDGDKVHGYYQDNRIDTLEPAQLASQQNVQRLPNQGLGFAGYLFNYDRVLHTVGRMWGQKSAIQNPQISDVNGFDPTNTVIEVKKQWWTFRLRNNSSRTVHIRVYKCARRSNPPAGFTGDPLTAWSAGITQMVADKQLLATPVLTANTLHTGPTISNQFRSEWKNDCVKITMEPGQYYTFNIEGPQMTYRGQDFYESGTYRSVQKQDVQLIWVSNADLVGTHTGTTAGNYGYAPDSISTEPYSERVIVESTYHCAVAMPEKVGGILQVAAFNTDTNFQNTARIRKTAIDDFASTTFGTTLDRRDEENPQAQVS